MSRLGSGIVGGMIGSSVSGSNGGPLKIFSYAGNAIFPTAIPGIPDVWDALLRGNIKGEKALQLFLMNGMLPPGDIDLLNPFRLNEFGQYDLSNKAGKGPSPWISYARNRIQMPSVGELIALLNRNYVTEDLVRHCLRRTGYFGPHVESMLMKLRYQIPGPSDLIRFVVREAFNEKQVAALGLDAEYLENEDYPFWAAAQGLGETTIPDGKGGKKSIDFAKLYWRAHWQLPSPTQAYEMLHRLRPGRTKRWEVAGVEPAAFGLDDLSALLKAQDYAQKWRIPLAAIAYRPLGRIDLRRLFANDIIGPAEYIAGLEDIGYVKEDAEFLWRLEAKAKAGKVAKSTTRIAKANIKKALRYGIFTEDEAFAALFDYGLAEADAKKALAGIRLELSLERATRAIASIKKRYMEGFLDRNEANQELQLAGVRAEKTFDFTSEWNRELAGGRRQLSAKDLQDALLRGLVTIGEFTRRLKVLGYMDVDISVMLSTVLQDAEQSAQRERLAAATALKKTQAEIERETLKLLRQLERRQKQVLVHGTPSRLAKWVQLGLISYQVAKARLIEGGWAANDADRLLLEPSAAKARKAVDDAIKSLQDRSQSSQEMQGPMQPT